MLGTVAAAIALTTGYRSRLLLSDETGIVRYEVVDDLDQAVLCGFTRSAAEALQRIEVEMSLFMELEHGRTNMQVTILEPKIEA